MHMRAHTVCLRVFVCMCVRCVRVCVRVCCSARAFVRVRVCACAARPSVADGQAICNHEPFGSVYELCHSSLAELETTDKPRYHTMLKVRRYSVVPHPLLHGTTPCWYSSCCAEPHRCFSALLDSYTADNTSAHSGVCASCVYTRVPRVYPCVYNVCMCARACVPEYSRAF